MELLFCVCVVLVVFWGFPSKRATVRATVLNVEICDSPGLAVWLGCVAGASDSPASLLCCCSVSYRNGLPLPVQRPLLHYQQRGNWLSGET